MERGHVEYFAILALDYVRAMNETCKKYPASGKIVDNPNIHRLVEFFVHTLPAYGSVKHIQELLFETMHQPLKRGVRNSNHRNPQLQAMEQVLPTTGKLVWQ